MGIPRQILGALKGQELLPRYFSMQSNPRTKFLLPTPIFVATGLLLAKLLLLPPRPGPSSVGALFGSDIALFGAVLVAAVLIPQVADRRLRLGGHLLLLLLLISYGLDTILRIVVNQPLNPADLLKYLGEWRAIASFIGWQHLLILLVIIATWHRRLPVSSGSNSSWFALGIASTLYGLASVPWAALVEESPRQRLNFIAAHPEANFYSPETISELSRDWPGQHQLDVPKEIRQIVLVVVESLSAEDSLRTSGLGHRLPRLDQLSRDGVLFDNFLANYSDTEGGVVSLFGGFPPIPYPGGNRSLYKAFEHGQSAVEGLNWMGFHTEFLTTGPLSFLSKGAYLREIGMQRVRGLNEVEDFAAAPRHSFDAPADALLYREALRRIEALEQSTRPYFLALLTVTSHRPPRDPDGRGNNQDLVWEYVDRQLFSFYQELRHQGFFEDGLLLITGDHRKMYPIPDEVQRHYGDSSVARVPLVAVGPGLPAGRIDHRLFQQSDLLRNLGGIAREDQPLTAMATYVERYTLHYTETSAYGGLRVIDAQGRVFPARVFGNRLVWQSEPPQQAASYELELA